MTRAEKVEIARALRAEGASIDEVAAIMGAPRGTITGYLTDPDLSKQRARRERYRGSCVDCGKPTDGANGPGRASERCNACSGVYRTYWTRERIVEAMQSWTRVYGDPPTGGDWNTSETRYPGNAARRERFFAGDYPPTPAVLKRFGTWNNAIEAAGFATLKPGGKRHQRVVA